MITVYGLKTCDSCRKTLAHLKSRNVEHAFVDIRQHPPSREELLKVMDSGVEPRRLMNTSGKSYRTGGFKDRVAEMSVDEVLDALLADPMLIKRPVVLTDQSGFVGHKEDLLEGLG